MWKCEEETLYNFQVQEGCAVAEESLKKGNKICGKNVYKKKQDLRKTVLKKWNQDLRKKVLKKGNKICERMF